MEELGSFRQEIHKHEAKQEKILETIRSGLEDDIKNQISAAVKNDIGRVLRAEVAKQVKEQVDVQITEHIPVSLQQQAEESKHQLQAIKTSLANSESRLANSNIQSGNLDDPLASILTSDGKKSDFYPSNLRSLFVYDLESARALNRDYGLVVADTVELNLKQFLAHIGTRVELVIH
ncbi:hypothetical protein B0H34DRAFT_700150 [Crassisporium funariophilum]|nr:hypothetical protein B0H34DRAFT_700150 [Crassisporium funariophilum]